MRDRVLKAIEELDYRPNYLARGLRQHSTSMLGLLLPDNSNPFYAEVARAIEDAGLTAGYSVILCNWDLSEEKLKAYLGVLISHKVDGMILINFEDRLAKSTLERIMTENIPIVLTNAEIPTTCSSAGTCSTLASLGLRSSLSWSGQRKASGWRPNA